MGWSYYSRWAPYVSVADRRRKALRHAAALKGKGRETSPVVIRGRQIAGTYWGRAWCDNLESYSDYANRLPRGRTYVRNGSVMDLQIKEGQVTALVSGSEVYTVNVKIKPVDPARWRTLVKECAGKIDSVVELLQGRFSRGVMELLSRRDKGLFPAPKQISLKCSCPDWAEMCKHAAAALYGVGARLDDHPELLFRLRKADHLELIGEAGVASALARSKGGRKTLEAGALADVFGIEIEPARPARRRKTRQRRPNDCL